LPLPSWMEYAGSLMFGACSESFEYTKILKPLPGVEWVSGRLCWFAFRAEPPISLEIEHRTPGKSGIAANRCSQQLAYFWQMFGLGVRNFFPGRSPTNLDLPSQSLGAAARMECAKNPGAHGSILSGGAFWVTNLGRPLPSPGIPGRANPIQFSFSSLARVDQNTSRPKGRLTVRQWAAERFGILLDSRPLLRNGVAQGGNPIQGSGGLRPFNTKGWRGPL